MFFLQPLKVKSSSKTKESWYISELDIVTAGNDPAAFWQDGHSTWQIANSLLAAHACLFYAQVVDMVCKTVLMIASSAKGREQVWK